MAAVVQVEGLTKNYGSRAAVVDLDFTVEQGEVFGYLGPNAVVTFDRRDVGVSN